MQIQSEKGTPTAEEAYNFFTFNFEPEPQEMAKKSSKKRKKQKKAGEEDRDEEGGEDVEEQEDAVVDEDNQDEHEDQVRDKKFYCVYQDYFHLFCACSCIRPSRFPLSHVLHPTVERRSSSSARRRGFVRH